MSKYPTPFSESRLCQHLFLPLCKIKPFEMLRVFGTSARAFARVRFQSTLGAAASGSGAAAESKKFTKSTLGGQDDFQATRAQNVQMSSHNNMPLQLALTPSAVKKLNILREEDPNLALRLGVSSGGCHGFQYNLDTTDVSTFKPENNETLFERDGAKLIADKETLEILRDSKVDYVTELIGESFKVVESPFTKSSCGCGSSFDVDFEKLEKEAAAN